MSTLNTFSPDLVKLVAAEKYERLLAEATAARLHQQIATKGSSQNRGVLSWLPQWDTQLWRRLALIPFNKRIIGRAGSVAGRA